MSLRLWRLTQRWWWIQPRSGYRQAVSGDPDAVFLAIRSELVRLASRTVGSRSEAEDVVQEVWLRWHRHHTDVFSPRNWLRRVTIRVALDRVRAMRARREDLVGADVLVADDVEPGRTPLEAVERVAGGVRVVLGALSPLERAVFVLREVLEWSYPDIARLLDRSEPALRQLNHRARARVAAPEMRFDVTPRALAMVSEALVAVEEGEAVEILVETLAPGLQLVRAGYERLSDGGLRHLVAGVVVWCEGRLLLCRRRTELPWYPGVWDVAGSHLRPGEPGVACAVRAARDELRISITAPELMHQVTGDEFELSLFLARTWEGEPRNVAPAQHTDVAFVTREQALQLPLANGEILTLFDRLAA